MCDEEKLRRIVMNLVSNAIKFTSIGGVTLRLRGSQGFGWGQDRHQHRGHGHRNIRRQDFRSFSSHFSKSNRGCREAMAERALDSPFPGNSRKR